MHTINGELRNMRRPKVKITLTCLRQRDFGAITSCAETLNACAAKYIGDLLEEPEPEVHVEHSKGEVLTYISYELMHRMAVAYNRRLPLNQGRAQPKLIWLFKGFDGAGQPVWNWRAK